MGHTPLNYLNNDRRSDFLNEVADKYLKDLDFHEVLLITHLLPDRPAFIDALSRHIDPRLILAIPYSINASAKEKIASNFRVKEPSLEELLSADYLSEQIAENFSGRFAVVEIGGYTTSLLKAQDSITDRIIGTIEGTESGIKRYAELSNIPYPVIGMPLSPVKTAESVLVGKSVLFSFEKILRAAGLTQEVKTAVVLGFGRIGESVAAEARLKGLDVYVYDPDPERRLFAIAQGFRVPDRENALRLGDVIFGCSGARSLHPEDFEQLQQRVFLVSATSKDVEFEFKALSKDIGCEALSDQLALLSYPSREIIVANEGKPVNFIDGADLGYILTLLQAEMIASLPCLSSNNMEKRVHTPDRTIRAALLSDWLRHFVSIEDGWFSPTYLDRGQIL